MIFSGDSLKLLIFCVIWGHFMYSKMKKTKKTESQLNLFNSSWISFSTSSLKLTKSSELGKREGLQGRNRFLQGVFQAHLHFNVVLSWDRKSIQNVNLSNMGAYKRQWEHCGVKERKELRQWMLPAVPVCTSVLANGLPLKRKVRHHRPPITNIQQHLCGIYLGPKSNPRLVEEGSPLQQYSPQSFLFQNQV